MKHNRTSRDSRSCWALVRTNVTAQLLCTRIAADIMEPIELDAAEPAVEEMVVEAEIEEEAAPLVEEVDVIVEVESVPAETNCRNHRNNGRWN